MSLLLLNSKIRIPLEIAMDCRILWTGRQCQSLFSYDFGTVLPRSYSQYLQKEILNLLWWVEVRDQTQLDLM